MARKTDRIHVPFPSLPRCYEGTRVMQRNRDFFKLMGISPLEVWSEDVTGQFHRFVVSLDRARNSESISNFRTASEVNVTSHPSGGRVETRTLIIQGQAVRVVDVYSMVFDEEGARTGTSWTVSLFGRAHAPRARKAYVWNRECDEPHDATSSWRLVDIFCAFFD